ncbi:hypothetical protein LP316_01375 [Thalassotalea sp. LPB0316]|uniref:hypothetical protein n=1 Tax=Thalassotalea sp. LPB0316 TaxID=2769490 RepID=UPI0018680BC3|nr:hypothetical protein [Thalassotalea sp. LPB0316]QOL25992.1 hypothetical protein LP316_01375 [Thalassotalea sp. LPB0316]
MNIDCRKNIQINAFKCCIEGVDQVLFATINFNSYGAWQRPSGDTALTEVIP